jgi:hypothetical protein
LFTIHEAIPNWKNLGELGPEEIEDEWARLTLARALHLFDPAVFEIIPQFLMLMEKGRGKEKRE